MVRRISLTFSVIVRSSSIEGVALYKTPEDRRPRNMRALVPVCTPDAAAPAPRYPLLIQKLPPQVRTEDHHILLHHPTVFDPISPARHDLPGFCNPPSTSAPAFSRFVTGRKSPKPSLTMLEVSLSGPSFRIAISVSSASLALCSRFAFRRCNRPNARRPRSRSERRGMAMERVMTVHLWSQDAWLK